MKHKLIRNSNNKTAPVYAVSFLAEKYILENICIIVAVRSVHNLLRILMKLDNFMYHKIKTFTKFDKNY